MIIPTHITTFFYFIPCHSIKCHPHVVFVWSPNWKGCLDVVKLFKILHLAPTTHLKDLTRLFNPFYSQRWLTCNFSPKYPYIIQQVGDENTQFQILMINLQENVQKLEGRINNQILGVKG